MHSRKHRIVDIATILFFLLAQAVSAMDAWYLEASYVPFRWEGWFEDEQHLRLIARFDNLDTNDEAGFTPFDRHRWTGGFEWQFAPNARFRTEFQVSKIHSFDVAPGPFLASGGEEYIQMVMLSAIFWF